MLKKFRQFQHTLAFKFILIVGITLLLFISAGAYVAIRHQKEKLMDNILINTNRLAKTIKLGTHYAMMLNSREDIDQIINNIAKQPEIKTIRIYNKEGQIKFTNKQSEVNTITNIKDEACIICHKTEPPLTNLDLKERCRIFYSPEGYRVLGIIDPVCNASGCSSGDCHIHPEDNKVLGALDLVVSLETTDKELVVLEKGIIIFAAFIFVATLGIIFFFVLFFLNHPIRKLIKGTSIIAKGGYDKKVIINQKDEMGQLAEAINDMGKEIGVKQAEIEAKRKEYQTLFEGAPCMITVQDKNFKLLRYNYEFIKRFAPEPASYCFKIYKGRDKRCVPCPMEKTFEDGMPHSSEETGKDKNGNIIHWMLITSPIKDTNGNIIAAMEMSIDITSRYVLENRLEESEKKYYAIFNNISNPVFVVDMDDLSILHCNNSVTSVYGYLPDEITGRPFQYLFKEKNHALRIQSAKDIIVKQLTKQGKMIYVNIRISPSEYAGKKVFLVTSSDITKRLETERQLVHAGKMAILGEMSSGVAHELNQPLSVIKTSSSFILRKISQKKNIEHDILHNMLEKIDSNVDRASKIINHMRQFARKSDVTLGKVHVEKPLKRAFDIFSQQLKVRGIEVVWNLADNLPEIMADTDRLEQVFINLLLNARDGIEEKWNKEGLKTENDKICIESMLEKKEIIIKIKDTGAGIPKAILNKIFEPFFTTKEVGKGTGLGLSISYGIIKECGGTIKAVIPENDVGTCFVLYFPVPAPISDT
jgi:histidine kinase